MSRVILKAMDENDDPKEWEEGEIAYTRYGSVVRVLDPTPDKCGQIEVQEDYFSDIKIVMIEPEKLRHLRIFIKGGK